MVEKLNIAVVGGGPAGLSAAARAAELGMSHLLLEASARIADTVARYQKGKRVMSEPAQLPLRSPLPFAEGTRESVLDAWQRAAAARGVHVRTGARVVAIAGRCGDFTLTLADGTTVAAEAVVLAIGLQGNIRRLGVPGEDLPHVQYHLDDPDEYADEAIVVVGGGDSGVENALALARRNRVVLVNRRDEFTSCSEANLALLDEAAAQGRIELRPGTVPLRVDAGAPGGMPLSLAVDTPHGATRIACHRIVARLGATPPRAVLQGFGIRFASEDANAPPELSARYESNVPGLYVIGALAGYPLIKQALNQGYEVVEHIRGHPVEPADEPLLRAKCARAGIGDAATGIDLVQCGQPLFAPLTALQLRGLLLAGELLAPRDGEVVFRRNDYGNSFFSILRGAVHIVVEGRDGTCAEVALPAGAFFGEIGLLSGRRRSATVIAGADCVLLEMPRRAMLRLLEAAPAVQRRLDEVALERVVRNCFGAALGDDQLGELVQSATTRHYAAGEVLFREGDAADALYLIRRGSVTISRHSGGREVVLAYVPAGNYVGEMALVSKLPRAATVRAAAPTEAVLLEARRFEAMIERNPAIRAAVTARYLERIRANESPVPGRDRGLVQFLVDQGVGEATDVLLIDYARCIRCDNCERACAEVHDGTSRLSRQAGRTYDLMHVPASCRHCEHPRCMRDCPPDAIHRAPSGEVFIDDSCIGCGNCGRDCPYGVIRLVGATAGWRRPSVLDAILGRRTKTDEGAAKRAVKCDMCRGIVGGAACVRACPTGAAFRAGPEHFLARAPRS